VKGITEIILNYDLSIEQLLLVIVNCLLLYRVFKINTQVNGRDKKNPTLSVDVAYIRQKMEDEALKTAKYRGYVEAEIEQMRRELKELKELKRLYDENIIQLKRLQQK